MEGNKVFDVGSNVFLFFVEVVCVNDNLSEVLLFDPPPSEGDESAFEDLNFGVKFRNIGVGLENKGGAAL